MRRWIGGVAGLWMVGCGSVAELESTEPRAMAAQPATAETADPDGTFFAPPGACTGGVQRNLYCDVPIATAVLTGDDLATCTSSGSNEDVYEFVCPAAGDVTVHLTGATCDVDLLVLDPACDATNCLDSSTGSGDQTVTFTCGFAGESFYVVAEDTANAGCAFDLEVDRSSPVCGPECVEIVDNKLRA